MPDTGHRQVAPQLTSAATIRQGSRSFALASRLFPQELRPLVWDLYAWCRHCDDVIDGQVLGSGQSDVADAASRLETLRRDSDRACRGDADPGSPFGALARVVAATGLPSLLVSDHLNGFAMDVAERRFTTLADTVEYSYHVAGVVGVMMAWIMGVRDHHILCRASDLGIAFQLSNIARDVGEDAEAGRIYLPQQWLDEAGASLTRGVPLSPAITATLPPVVARLVAEAERYYDSASIGIGYLPGRSAWAVATARLVYRRIGRLTVARRSEAWRSRTVVSTPFKLACILVGGVQAARPRRAAPEQSRARLYTPATVAVLR